VNEYIPADGSQPRLTAKIIISICPSQKLGKEYKKRDDTIVISSLREYGLLAA
jgi:hypothetical protein